MLLVPASALFHWAAPLFLLVVVAATIYMASQIMSPLFDGSSKRAFQHLGKLNLGIWRGFQIIEDGETAFPKDQGRPLGPTMTIIRANNVAILEGGPSQPRIVVGPTVQPTGRFEYVKKIFDLKPKGNQRIVKGCITTDGMEIDVALMSLSGLNVSDQTRKDPSKITVFESTFLYKLHMDMPDWEAHFASVLEQATRHVINKYKMTSLVASANYETISQEIQNYLDNKLSALGIRTLNLTVERITLPPNFLEAKAEAVATSLATEILTIARRDGLVTMADAYKIANGLGMPDDLIKREFLRSTLELVAQQPGVGALLSPALSAMLREVLESLRP